MNMKKNVWYVMLLMAAMFAGCAAERDGQNTAVNNGKASVNPDSIPVAFDGYQNRATSRSGWAGVFDNDQLKETKANGGGFGVFAYYTDLKKYDQTYVPNFMYNQGVFWNGEDGTLTGDYFAYSPIMYWPNEYGFDASSDDEDHVTFFAYAPFVESASAAAGSVSDATYGITGFSRNTATGDPMVKYIASFDPEKSVDLCWGVVPADKTSWPKIQGGGTMTLTEGLPWLDMERPLETATQAGASSTSRIKFKFNHALAQLNVQIDTDADITTHTDSGDELADGTKVYVRSISFSGIALKGALNLNNTVKDQALWLDYSCTTDLAFGQSVTVHDGRRDSREGVQGAEAANETPTGLNPDIIQNSTATPGVTHEYQNLFAPTSPIAIPGSPTPAELAARLEDAICVIPTGESMTITIVYDIEMEDPDLTSYLSDGKTHGLSIENKVTKTVSFGGVAGAGLESNKRYALKLHLGMNSVKFDAEVQDWATNTVNGEGWLPSNTRPIVLNKSVMYIVSPQTLTATTDPLGQAVIWDNTDGSIASLPGLTPSGAQHIDASVVNNTVTMTPVSIGTTTVTASLASGDKAICEVNVVPVIISSTNVPTPDKAITESVNKDDVITLTPHCYNVSGTPNVTWTIDDPTIADITPNADGTCTVTCKKAGSAVIICHNDDYTDPTDATCTLNVTSLTPTYTPPTPKALTYNGTSGDNGTAQGLVMGGSVTGGTGAEMQYAMGTSSAPTGSYSTTIPTQTDAGTYYVWYKVVGGSGYTNVTDLGPVAVTIAKKTPELKLQDYDIFQELSGGSVSNFTDLVSNSGEVGVDMYTKFHIYHNAANSPTVTSATPAKATASISGLNVTVTGVDVGSSVITVNIAESTNYKAASETFTATVVQAIDLDLSVKWYYKNIGAASPTDYGNYYTWGATVTQTIYTYGVYNPGVSGAPYQIGGGTNPNNSTDWSKYNGSDSNYTLLPDDDVATVVLGGSWKMPTIAELSELISITRKLWCAYIGQTGYMFIKHNSGETDNLLFLSATGLTNGSTQQLMNTEGNYWSSSVRPSFIRNAQYIFFNSTGIYLLNADNVGGRAAGFSVRAVQP